MNANEYHFIREKESFPRVPLITRLAYTSDGKLEYSGLARKGSLSSDASWLIEKFVYTGDNLTQTLMSEFNQVWDDRETTVSFS
jgi:hypothetical protein